MKKPLVLVIAVCLATASAITALWYLYSQNQLSPWVNPLLETFNFTKPTPPVSWGFLPYWSISKWTDKYYQQFTHINFFSLTLNPDGTIKKMDNAREQEPGWTALQRDSTKKLLQTAKNRGQTLSLTLFSGTTSDIANIVSDPAGHAQNTINDVVPLMEEYGFSDLNIDLEDPIETPQSTRTSFNKYVAELDRLLKIRLPQATISLDYISISTVRPRLTDLKELNFYVDRFIVMAYDYHSPGSTVAGPVAPASGSGELRSFDTTAAIDSALTLIPKYKLVLGVPIYGYQWQTLSPTLGSATIPRTGQTATAARVEELLRGCPNCQTGWDDIAQEAWAIIPEGDLYSQVFYGNERALASKIETAKAKNLGGIAIWALGYEGQNTLTPLEEYVRLIRPN